MSSPETLDYQHVQTAFSDWIRQPDRMLPSGIEARRMQVYHDLLYHNIESFITHCYPICQAMLPAGQWTALVDGFFRHGQCDSPYYYDISLHFREFIAHVAEADSPYPPLTEICLAHPWLCELLQYEWLGLYVDMAETTWLPPAVDRSADAPIILRTTCWVLAYQYPVQQWTVDDHPSTPTRAPICLLVYRTADFALRVYPLHPLWAYLLEQLQQTGALRPSRLTQLLADTCRLPHVEAAETVQALQTWLLQIGLS